MLKATAICLTLAMGMSPACAWAANHADDDFAGKQQCYPLSKVKDQFGEKELAKMHFGKLTPGQTNFARGGYAATPPIDGKMPYGDTARLITRDGGDGGVILWMKGPLVCGATPIPQGFLKALKAVKTGALDSDGNEI